MSLDWATRGTLRIYPQRWRDEYEQEVIGTLLDVADDEQRSRPALRELLPLAVRGAWLRARTSITFWVGLVVIGTMLWTLAQSFDGFLSERYWPVMLSRPGAGLILALPLVAASAAWQAGRRRERLPLQRRLTHLAVDAAGPAVFAAIGYLATLIAQIVVSGWPVTANTDPRIPLAFFCMLLAALAVGSLLGTLIIGRLASPIAWLALTVWFLFPVATNNIQWMNVVGTGLIYGSVETLYSAPLGVAVLATSLSAVVIAALAIALVAIKLTRGWVWAAVVVLGIGAAVGFNAPAIGAWATTGSGESRDPSSLVCAGSVPNICLWPEQEVAGGKLVRSAITTAYVRAAELGIPVPATTSVVAAIDPLASTFIYWRGVATTDRVITNYAQAVTVSFACQWSEWPNDVAPMTTDSYDRAEQAAEYAAAVAFGADPIASMPTIQVGGEADKPAERTLRPEEIQDNFGVHSVAEAQAVILTWVERGPTCE